MKNRVVETFREISIFGMTGCILRIRNDFSRSVNSDYYMDGTLVLYSTAMDGRSAERQELTFDARFTFDSYEDDYPNHYREAGGENLSVLYDHSTMYYFNKKGVFKYSLLDKKTSKLSTIHW